MPAATNTATMVQCFLMNPFHSEPSIPTVTALGLRSPFWNRYKENRAVYLKGKRVDRTYFEYLSGIRALTHRGAWLEIADLLIRNPARADDNRDWPTNDEYRPFRKGPAPACRRGPLLATTKARGRYPH